MKKFYSLIATVAIAVGFNAQLTLPFSDTFTYADGDMSGKGNWTIQSANATDKINVDAGVVKFDGGGEDLQNTFTSTNSGTLYYSMDIKVTGNDAQTDTNGGYFAGFAQNSTTFGGTLWTQRVSATEYKFGIEVRTATGTSTTWTTANYTVGTTYRVTVSYEFVTGTANDVVNLYVNNTLVSTDNHTGTDLTSAVAFFLRQDSASETPFVEIDNLTVSADPSAVLAVSDSKKSNNLFIKNTLVKNDEITFGSDVKDIKIYTLSGAVVKTGSVKNGATLNVAELAKGNYIVTGMVNNQPVSQKILKD